MNLIEPRIKPQGTTRKKDLATDILIELGSEGYPGNLKSIR